MLECIAGGVDMQDGVGPVVACLPIGEQLGKDPLALIGSLGSVDDVDKGFMAWPVSGFPEGTQRQFFTFRDGPVHDSADVATALVASGSFPDCAVDKALPAVVGSDQEQALLQLSTKLYVEQLEGSHWRLTDIGLKKLISVSRLGQPSLVCQPRPGVPLEDQTSHELILLMHEGGWTWARWVGSRGQPSGYRHGQPKHWFTSGVTVCKAYLTALLRADDLFEQGLEMIPHAAKEQVPHSPPTVVPENCPSSDGLVPTQGFPRPRPSVPLSVRFPSLARRLQPSGMAFHYVGFWRGRFLAASENQYDITYFPKGVHEDSSG